MSNVSFENYGMLAERMTDFTQVAGRYACQRDDEKNIVQDVIRKLDLSVNVSLLEIGCGAGNLLIPLSFFVHSATGIDHPSCIAALKERFQNKNFVLIGNNFFDCTAGQLCVYHRILVYSVLHYLGDDDVELFINKAISLLQPGGKMLLGDIPNISKKQRFLTSEEGRLFVEKWNQKMATKDDDMPKDMLDEDSNIAEFNDSKILSLLKRIRESGCNAYLLPQPVNLPFGYTREDILIEKLA